VLDRTTPVMGYLPCWWRRHPGQLLIGTAVAPARRMPAIRRAVRALDADIAIGETGPLERLVTASTAVRRPQRLFLAFGAVARSIARQCVVSIMRASATVTD